MEKESIKALVKMLGPIAWLALAAGLQMLGALLFFRAPADLILIFTYALITFSVYLLNRFTDNEDGYNYPEQRMFFQQKSKLIILPIFLMAFTTFILAITGRLVIWHIIMITCGISYSVSLIPFMPNKSFRFVRFKDIFFVKNIVVSLLWGISPFALASSQKGAIIPTINELIVVIAAFCITSFINTTSCDVRDIAGDRQLGLLTLPTRLGEKFTVLFLLLIGFAGCLFVGINYYLGNVSRPAILLFVANMVWTGFVAAPIYMKKNKLPKIISEPLIDSQFVMNGISLIVLSRFL